MRPWQRGLSIALPSQHLPRDGLEPCIPQVALGTTAAATERVATLPCLGCAGLLSEAGPSRGDDRAELLVRPVLFRSVQEHVAMSQQCHSIRQPLQNRGAQPPPLLLSSASPGNFWLSLSSGRVRGLLHCL